ncbi:MAG: hypothetical protein KME42_16955 [Tildeniella nuda ZEHNDER 1965/U140]|jgi:hypothetical protein|nr:hypothetical protein [Tildeniella nuda ZEHNDER 1965/U140]
MQPQYKAIKRFLLTIILVGDVVALVLLLGVISSLVASIAVLLYLSPFIPDLQVRLGKAASPDATTAIILSLAWIILTTLLGSRLCKGEVQPKRRQVRPLRHLGPNTPYSTPCKACYYWQGYDREARRFLEHPCALHPTGKPDVACLDWQHSTDR